MASFSVSSSWVLWLWLILTLCGLVEWSLWCWGDSAWLGVMGKTQFWVLPEGWVCVKAGVNIKCQSCWYIGQGWWWMQPTMLMCCLLRLEQLKFVVHPWMEMHQKPVVVVFLLIVHSVMLYYINLNCGKHYLFSFSFLCVMLVHRIKQLHPTLNISHSYIAFLGSLWEFQVSATISSLSAIG